MGEKYKFPERRKYIRVSMNAYVAATLASADISQEKVLISKDFSPEGMFLFTNESLPVGTILNLKIQTPTTREPIKVEAKVVRVAKDTNSRVIGVGLIFARISDNDKKELFKHIYLAYHHIEIEAGR